MIYARYDFIYLFFDLKAYRFPDFLRGMPTVAFAETLKTVYCGEEVAK